MTSYLLKHRVKINIKYHCIVTRAVIRENSRVEEVFKNTFKFPTLNPVGNKELHDQAVEVRIGATSNA